jgi:hypothetical protein
MADKYYPFPMATFKEIEPTLKKCFNIDRNTPTIAKCLFYSLSTEERHKIPENYLLEDGEPDFDAYTMDYAESLIIPISETCSTTDFNNFCQSNNIEYETTLYEILAFLLLFNDTSNKKYSTDLDQVEQESSEYDLYVRPELLQLYIALKENKKVEPITIRLGSSKSIKVDQETPWLREALGRYLYKYLGVADLTEAKLEYFENYDPKDGAPNDRKLNRYIRKLAKDGNYKMSLLIALGCFTGLRISDILALTWEQILNTEEFTITEKKTGKKRVLRLNPQLQQHIQECHEHIQPLNDTSYILVRQKGALFPFQRIKGT